jgi:hypothetical protein
MGVGMLLIRRADHYNPSWLSQSFGFHHTFVGIEKNINQRFNPEDQQ